MDLFGETLVDPEDEVSDEDRDPDYGSTGDIGREPGRSNILCAPRSMAFCLGHEDQEQSILDILAAGRLPHAMVFSGPKGIGKCTFAFRFARFLLRQGYLYSLEEGLFGSEDAIIPDSMDISENDPVFSRVASGGHGDLLFIERAIDPAKGREKAELTAEVVRKIPPFLRKTSSEGGWRVVIVDDADTMNNTAQNAILKILEEPPDKVAIILITHRTGALIPTIRSRCRVLPFRPLDEHAIQNLLARQGYIYSPSDAALIFDFSCGSIGTAIQFAEEGGPELFREILALLASGPEWNWLEIHKFSQSFFGTSGDKRYFLTAQIMTWLFEKLAFVRARGGVGWPAYLADNRSERAVISGFSCEKLAAIADDLSVHFQRTEFSNLDKRETVRSAFLMINP